jgi:membrane associated rhomboid family serine protease
VTPQREPILTIPSAMTGLLALLAVVHLVRLALPTDLGEWVVWVFGFVPARYDLPLSDARFPGGAGAAIWSFLTYALLHADFNHILFNTLWMLPFGSAVARRFGGARFFAFLAVTAVAGAIAHLATHPHEVAPMIGASAAVSGAMAAAIRFAFARGSFLSFRRPRDVDSATQVPALPLSQALRNPQVLVFLGVWFGVNIVFGVGSIAVGAAAQSIAWQAHIGGFVAGLVLFSLFDPVARAAEHVDDAGQAEASDGGESPPHPRDGLS